MKTLILAAAICAAATPALAATSTNVSIAVGQPGFYGRIDIGNFPQPVLINPEPVIIQREVRVVGSPIYLRVPPGHIKHWDKHCREYNACNQRVYFVHDDWYNNTYAPRYREEEREHGHGKGHDKHDKHDKHEKHGDKDHDH